MANFQFVVAKGQSVAFYQNVYNNSPAGCALEVLLLSATGLEGQSTMQNRTSVADMLTGTGSPSKEATNTGYARKILVAANLAAPAADYVNEWYPLSIPNQTWTAVAATGGASAGNIGALVVAYRPAAGSADSAIIPMTCHTFAISCDGSDITAQIPAGGFFQAT